MTLPLHANNGWSQSTTSNTPSQTPLVTRDGGQPKPNVMVTLDTSWSMIFPYVPEGAFTVNNKTVNFPGFTSPIMHPNDPRHDPGQQATVEANQRVGDGGVIAADVDDTTTVFPRQMRSPDVNQLYYNPRQLYLPWRKVKDTNGSERYANADAKKAWFDPDKTGTTDLYADLTASATTIETVWCTTNPAPGDKLSCSKSKKSFSPAIYYLLKDGAVDPTSAGSYVLYNVNKPATGQVFTKYTNRTDCVGATCTAAEELQNYANWFVYYRTRLHMVQAAIPESFLQLGNTIRTGWGTIHQGTSSIDGQNTAIVQSGVRDFDATRKSDLVNWIRNFRSDKDVTDASTGQKLTGGTPLLSALKGVGDYFSRKDNRSPWVTDPSKTGGDTSVPLSCRRSYNLLITDGYYKDESGIANEDGTSGVTLTQKVNDSSTPKTYTYTPQAPFSDNRSGTLADLAMKYWKTDLQNLDNNVPPGNNTVLEDPAFWQHLVQFPIGLGVSGNIPLNDLTNQLKLLSNGSRGWWDGNSSVSATDPRRIDDLLHAAINSRGQYFSAKNAAEMTSALTTALNRVAERQGLKESGVGAASLTLVDDNVKYIPEYTTTSWTGDVKSYTLDSMGLSPGEDAYTWKASEHVPAPDNRKIYTWNGTVGAEFKWGTIGPANQALINSANVPTGATAENLLNYIRGDKSKEDSASAVNQFRQRTGTLPDFINSNPVLVKGNVNLHYEKLPTSQEGQSTYAHFANITKPARQPVLFVGGNGGMLHAFADYTATNVVPGQEVFAYVPKTVLPNLGILAQKTYGRPDNYHRFFVDGPLLETDIYTNDWKNILVGTLGAGGKGIFALDVTNTTTLNATSVLWEVSSADDNNIGYITSSPQVGVLPNGEWAVFVGNGTHSTNGKAALIVIRFPTTTSPTLRVNSIEVDAATGNGLGGVTLVKNANQQVVGAYAGDLKGRVWRFDVSSNGAVTVGLNGGPLYTATDLTGTAQPITAPPAIMAHPNGGNLVLVGTGKLIDEGDNDTQDTQTLYALWDKPTPGGGSAFAASPGYKLVRQTIDVSTRSSGYFNVSSNKVDYSDNVLGWYIDLNIDPGQRVVYPPVLIRDYVYASTIVPAPAAAYCAEASGQGYNFLLPALTGAQGADAVLDTNGDNFVTNKDLVRSVYTSGADGGDTILTRDNSPDGNGQIEISFQNTKGRQNALLPPKTGKPLEIQERTWRQILNPPHP